MKRMIIALALLLTACSTSAESKETHLTIKPVELNEHEKQLVTKAGADNYQYFELDGHLAEKDDLIIASPIFKNGEKVSNGTQSFGMLENEYENSLFSISLDHYGRTVIMGSPGGTVKSKYELPEGMSVSGFRNNVREETALKKDETLYLAYWFNKKGNSIRTAAAEPTKLSSHVKNSDYAIVYTITLVEEEKSTKEPGD